MNLKQLATIINAELLHATGDETFQGINYDSRTVKPQQLFFALAGEKVDGHQFLEQAFNQGALAAVVSQKTAFNYPQLLVKDTLAAMLKLAAYWRNQFDVFSFAITGSCGKTTTRAMLQKICEQVAPTLASERSLNTNVGVPYTILQLNDRYRYYVQEIGANHKLEIDELVRIVKPNVSIITLIAPIHLEGFGSIAGVIKAKSEIFNGLGENGVAVLNRDDAEFDALYHNAQPHRVVTFGVHKDAMVRATDVALNEKGQLRFNLHLPEQEPLLIQTEILAKHNVTNALAAASAAWVAGIDAEAIHQGLSSTQAVYRRFVQHQGFRGATIIDDSYNSNPVALKAAIDWLVSQSRRPILVMGEMGELGERAPQFHEELGEYAKTHGVQQLYCWGTLTQHSAKAFGDRAYYFEDKNALIDQLKQQVEQDHMILVKGSLYTAMNQVTEALLKA